MSTVIILFAPKPLVSFCLTQSNTLKSLSWPTQPPGIRASNTSLTATPLHMPVPFSLPSSGFPLAVPQIPQVCSSITPFALAVSSVWNVLSTDDYLAYSLIPSGLSSNITLKDIHLIKSVAHSPPLAPFPTIFFFRDFITS